MRNLYADGGTSMRCKPVAALQADLDVAQRHSSPYVLDGNSFSEAQFEPLKYRHDFPARFGCLVDARAFCQQLFAGYDDQIVIV